MQQSLLISLICEDKPGIIEALSNVIAEHNGSWQESKMGQQEVRRHHDAEIRNNY